jgi:hypothetical protein
MSSVVYWIRHEDHTDMFTQGYIGVSSQVEKRWEYHKKHGENAHLRNAINLYGWDKLVKQVLLISDLAYCLMIEAKLRSEDKIGWNVVKGGGKPPVATKGYKRSKETLLKMSLIRKGKAPWNKGKKLTEAQKVNQYNLVEHVKKYGSHLKGKKLDTSHMNIKVTCPHCAKISLLGVMKRWHFDNCKFKEKN